jgi:hypothetical protein
LYRAAAPPPHNSMQQGRYRHGTRGINPFSLFASGSTTETEQLGQCASSSLAGNERRASSQVPNGPHPLDLLRARGVCLLCARRRLPPSRHGFRNRPPAPPGRVGLWARRCYLPASDAASGPAPLPTRLISCVPGKDGAMQILLRDVAGGVNHLRLRSETTPAMRTFRSQHTTRGVVGPRVLYQRSITNHQ